MDMWKRILFALPLLGAFFNLQAYYFGKNKVQYRNFDWKIVKTKHFRIFVVPEEEHLIPFASSVLESTYSEYSRVLHTRKFDGEIPVLIYPSPNSFKQTNVTLDVIDEFTGGFTEIFKNRVVVPFNGSYLDFNHVLRHELVHVFQFHIFYKGVKSYHIPPFTMSIPLWVMEGMAEYFSWGGWSPDAEMFMRDLVLNDKVVPIEELEYYGGWLIYKEGQAIFCFLNDVYGPEKTREFIYQLKMSGNVDKAFKKVTGKDAAELNDEFSVYLKKKFFPSVEQFEFPIEGRSITEGENSGFLNFGVLSPDGGRIALISDRSGYTDIYIVSAFDGRIEKKLVEGEKSPSFENLHLVRPSLSFSKDGHLLVFTASRGGYDALYVFDVDKDKKVAELRPERHTVWAIDGDGNVEKIGKLPIESVYEPVFSPDGNKIAFVGIQSAQSDLFMYDFEEDRLYRLTDNPFDERTPVFSKDGKTIYFLTDFQGRSWDGHFGSYAIYGYSIENNELYRLSPFLGDINSLTLLNDSLLGFTAVLRAARNVFAFDIKHATTFQITDFPSNIRLISADSSCSELGFSAIDKGKWSYFVLSNPLDRLKPVDLEAVPEQYVALDTVEHATSSYKTRYSVDWVQGILEYETSTGLSGWMTVGLSDELGNHRMAISTDRYSGNTNLYFQYADLTRRTDFYVSAFHYWDWGLLSYYAFYRQRNLGLSAGITYPFSKFSRLDFDVTFRHPTDYIYVYDENLGGFYLYDVRGYNSLELTASYVVDRALYTYFGPLSGDRGAIEIHTEALSPYKFSYALFDYRKYSPISQRSLLATRVMGGQTMGEYAPMFWLGGPSTLRGYYFYEFGGRNFVLTNFELRVPFIDTLKLSFPFPIQFVGIRGVLFMDIGGVNIGRSFRAFESNQWGDPTFKDIKADAGYGFRIYLAPGLALRFDFAKKFNFLGLTGPTMYYMSIDWDY